MTHGPALAVLLAIASGACSRSSPAKPRVTQEIVATTPAALERLPSSPSPMPTPPDEGVHPHRFVDSLFDEDELLVAMERGRPRSFKSVGNTSVVLRVRLDGDTDVAWKPRMRERPEGYLAEIATYAVARLLGLDDVPPVLPRRFRDERIAAAFEGDPERYAEVRGAIAWDDDGSAPGAAIYWVPRMADLGGTRVSAALDRLRLGAAMPDEVVPIERDLSNVVVLDYLVANWDRFSGANLQGVPDGTRLFARDHDRAFLEPLPPHVTEKLDRTLARVERFSRRTIDRVRGLDREALARELARAGEHLETPVLDETRVRALFARRDALVRHVDALVRAHGAGEVLHFE